MEKNGVNFEYVRQSFSWTEVNIGTWPGDLVKNGGCELLASETEEQNQDCSITSHI